MDSERVDNLALAPVFRALRDRWLQRNVGSTGADLAARLGVSRTRVSGWTSGTHGSDPGHPTPLWAVRVLARELGIALTIEGDSVSLVERTTPGPR